MGEVVNRFGPFVPSPHTLNIVDHFSSKHPGYRVEKKDIESIFGFEYEHRMFGIGSTAARKLRRDWGTYLLIIDDAVVVVTENEFVARQGKDGRSRVRQFKRTARRASLVDPHRLDDEGRKKRSVLMLTSELLSISTPAVDRVVESSDYEKPIRSLLNTIDDAIKNKD